MYIYSDFLTDIEKEIIPNPIKVKPLDVKFKSRNYFDAFSNLLESPKKRNNIDLSKEIQADNKLKDIIHQFKDGNDKNTNISNLNTSNDSNNLISILDGNKLNNKKVKNRDEDKINNKYEDKNNNQENNNNYAYKDINKSLTDRNQLSNVTQDNAKIYTNNQLNQTNEDFNKPIEPSFNKEQIEKIKEEINITKSKIINLIKYNYKIGMYTDLACGEQCKCKSIEDDTILSADFARKVDHKVLSSYSIDNYSQIDCEYTTTDYCKESFYQPDTIEADILIMAKCCSKFFNTSSEIYNNLMIYSKLEENKLKNNSKEFRFKQEEIEDEVTLKYNKLKVSLMNMEREYVTLKIILKEYAALAQIKCLKNCQCRYLNLYDSTDIDSESIEDNKMRFKEYDRTKEVNPFEYKQYKDLQALSQVKHIGSRSYKVYDENEHRYYMMEDFNDDKMMGKYS